MPTSTRATRRRTRRPDALAHPAAIQKLLQTLRERVADDLPKTPQAVNQLLIAIRHQETYGATQSKRGRPSRFDKAQMRRVADALKTILQRETQGRISLRTFVDHYLRILDFPAELIAALADQQINLFEAEQLARLTPQALQTNARATERMRRDLLKTHLISQESGTRLRLRVNQMLKPFSDNGENTEPTPVAEFSAAGFNAAELAESFAEPDPTHLFYDQLQQIRLMMTEIVADELSNEALDQILNLSDQLLNALARARKKQKHSSKLPV